MRVKDESEGVRVKKDESSGGEIDKLSDAVRGIKGCNQNE